jgi:C-terminal processing protease CtpA/Prc
MILPLHVKYVGSKLYIVDTWENSTHLKIGDQVLTINGVKVGSLREEIFQHISSDGLSESYKHENLNLLFGVYFAMYFDFPTSYTVTVLKNGKEEEVKLEEGENFDGKKTFLDDCENRLCFDADVENNAAIITIRSFAYYGKDLPIFKSFIDSCFNQIKENKIENLIIDLRNNGGGDPFCGSYLIQQIADKPFTYFHKDVWAHADLKKTIHPITNAFKPKPYILTNGLCFSTTGHFCSIVKENNFGIFIGDETGATYTCNDNSKIYTLENTKLLLKVARNTYYTSASTLTNKHGIIPDYSVIPDIDDILNNTDTVLNYALKLIEKE